MNHQNVPVVQQSTPTQVRYYDHTAYLERSERPQTPQIVEIDSYGGMGAHPAFTAHDGAQESTNSQDRARGLVIRLLPLACILLLLTIGGGLVLMALTDLRITWVVIVGLIVFAGMCLFAYNRESLKDYEFSRAGLERHRIDMATVLKEQELEYQYRLRQMALEHHVRMVEAMGHDHSN